MLIVFAVKTENISTHSTLLMNSYNEHQHKATFPYVVTIISLLKGIKPKGMLWLGQIRSLSLKWFDHRQS